MGRKNLLIAEPRSRFVKVSCPDCGNEQVIFGCASTKVRCLVCNRILAVPSGGKAKIQAKIIKVLG